MYPMRTRSAVVLLLVSLFVGGTVLWAHVSAQPAVAGGQTVQSAKTAAAAAQPAGATSGPQGREPAAPTGLRKWTSLAARHWKWLAGGFGGLLLLIIIIGALAGKRPVESVASVVEATAATASKVASGVADVVRESEAGIRR
jgi:hypothetical protein